MGDKYDNKNELEIAWDNLIEAIKQERPFKFIYASMIKLIEWLAKRLR